MSNQQDQDELTVFHKFAKHFPSPIQIDSIRKCDASEPDILCQLQNGTPLYFELVECIDERLARSIYGGFNEGGFFEDDLYVACIRDKFGKRYKTGAHRCDLLAYFDLQPIIPERSWRAGVEAFIEKHVKETPFHKVWIYSVPQDKVISAIPL